MSPNRAASDVLDHDVDEIIPQKRCTCVCSSSSCDDDDDVTRFWDYNHWHTEPGPNQNHQILLVLNKRCDDTWREKCVNDVTTHNDVYVIYISVSNQPLITYKEQQKKNI